MQTNLFNSTTDGFLLTRLVLTIIISVLCFIAFSLWIIKIDNELFFSIIYMMFSLFIYHFLKRIFIIKVEFIFEENFKIKIYKQFFLSYEKTADYDFLNIKSYYYESGIFRITTKKGKNVKLIIDNENKNLQQFYDSYNDFKRIVEKYNSINISLHEIKEDLPYHETKLAKFYAVIILIILIAIPFLYVYNHKKINIGLLLIIYSSSLMYVYKVYRTSRKKD